MKKKSTQEKAFLLRKHLQFNSIEEYRITATRREERENPIFMISIY